MSDSSLLPEDPSRRAALLTTCSVGAVGGAAVAWPFLKSLKPSERALAAGAPVEVDIAGGEETNSVDKTVEEGERLIRPWEHRVERGASAFGAGRIRDLIAKTSDPET